MKVSVLNHKIIVKEYKIMSVSDLTIKSNYKYYLLALLWPFGALLACLKNWRTPWAMNVFWIFCAFAGFIHIYTPEGGEFGEGSDIERYVIRLENLHNGIISFEDVIDNHEKPDYYQLGITYFVSRFTDDGHVLFLVFGAIFGFFYSRNMWFILRKLPSRLPQLTWVLIGLFFLVCPIWNVSGVRMWTALQVFVYGALPSFFNKYNYRLIWCLITPFIHFSFIFPLIIFGLFWALPNFLKSGNKLAFLSLIILLMSFFINVLDIQSIGNLLETYFPALYEDNMAGYLGDEYVDKINEFADQKSILFKIVTSWSSLVLCFMSFFCVSWLSSFNDKKAKKIRCLLIFGMLFYAFANIISIVPSGGRFLSVAQMFLIPAIILSYVYFNNNQYLSAVKFLLFISILNIIFDIRIGCEAYGYNLLIGNFLWGIPMENNISLIRYLKS